MSILNKIMETMRLNEADDDEDDGYFDEEYEEDERPARRRLFNKQHNDDYEYDEKPEQRPRFLSRPASNNNNKVVPLRRGMEVSLIKPVSMEDSHEICERLLEGKAVVLNLEGIHLEVAQRIIDFTCGATYSMDGNLQKISGSIFIATPSTVELSGDFRELLSNAPSGAGMNVSGLSFHL